jgi:Tfp pilus assembly PilM family ATPase
MNPSAPQPSPFIHKLLTFIRARSPVGGLEVSDSVLRFSYFDGKTWQLKGVRIPPGVVIAGKIKNLPSFLECLKNLHLQASGNRDRKDINVIVCPSSINVYTQSIAIPAVRFDSVDRAIELNLKIASPSDIDTLYTGWQFLADADTSGQIQVMGAFVNNVLIDELISALKTGHFVPVAVEPRALSLIRLFRTWGLGVERDKAYVLLVMDALGMDFLIMRNGDFYFDYFVPWRDFQENGKPLPEEQLKIALARSLNQVVNYYEQHWKDPALSTIFVLAGGLYEKVKAMIAENYTMEVRPLQLKIASAMPAEWFAVLGSGIRGTLARQTDKDINLMGLSAMKEFAHQQMIIFLSFWSILLPTALAVLVAVFLGANLFASSIYKGVSQTQNQGINPQQQTELNNLVAEVAAFNGTISALAPLQSTGGSKVDGAQAVLKFFADEGLTVTHFQFPGYRIPIALNGKAPSVDTLLAVRKSMEANPNLQNVNLPPSNVQPQPDGSAAFSMSFVVVSSSLSAL